MKPGLSFEPHLVVNEISLPHSAEWVPNVRGWLFLQIRSGISYWRQPNNILELSPGSSLVITGEARGGVRASQLSDVGVAYFSLEAEQLFGLLSLGEQWALKKATSREQFSVRLLPANDPLSERFKNLCLNRNGADLSLRLQLLQLFLDLFKGELEQGPVETVAEDLEGRARLRHLMKQTAASEFLNMSLTDLAPKMHCSPRHLSRLFREEMGTSFRDKQTEMKLQKACHLLATSKAKVIEVGLNSGYHSNSLFNFMFKKHFGVSPKKWRQLHANRNPRRQKFARMLPV